MKKEKFITDREQTRIYKSHHGWMGETYLNVHGYSYMITTMKRHSGIVVSNAIEVNDEGRGNGFVGVSYSPFTAKKYELATYDGKATETKIREVHTKALALFDMMKDTLPKKSEAYEIKPGQAIFLDGYGNTSREIVYAVDDDYYHTVNEDTLEINKHQPSTVRDYEKKFGIGMYYKQGDVVDVEYANNLLLDAKEKAKKDAEEQPFLEEAKAAEREMQIEALERKFSYLEKHDKYSGAKSVAANMRIELKRAFPSIKFSVRKDSYDTVYISWDDGPAEDQVKSIYSKYKDHERDFTGDFMDYSPSLFNEVFGGCKFIFTRREMTQETEDRFVAWANERFSEGQTYNESHSASLARSLFYHCEIPKPGIDWVIEPTGKTCGISRPEEFWQVTPQTPDEAIQADSENCNFSEVSGNCTVTHNTEKNGIEISFEDKPAAETIEQIKANGFRWSRYQKLWWAKYTDARMDFARSI